jgi:hypothetical protein
MVSTKVRYTFLGIYFYKGTKSYLEISKKNAKEKYVLFKHLRHLITSLRQISGYLARKYIYASGQGCLKMSPDG